MSNRTKQSKSSMAKDTREQSRVERRLQDHMLPRLPLLCETLADVWRLVVWYAVLLKILKGLSSFSVASSKMFSSSFCQPQVVDSGEDFVIWSRRLRRKMC